MSAPRHALITGASTGFGHALGHVLRSAGWHVVAVCRSTPPDDPDWQIVPGDITEPATVESIAHALEGRTLDLLVNNAGLSGGGRSLGEVTRDHLERSFATNVVAPLEIVRACRPALAAAGGALVVNVSSRLASMARQAVDHYGQADLRTSYAYRITKAAQNMLTIALSQELSEDDIAFWAVHPGRLTTRLGSRQADTSPGQAARHLLAQIDARKPSDRGVRFISIDPREASNGSGLPW